MRGSDNYAAVVEEESQKLKLERHNLPKPDAKKPDPLQDDPKIGNDLTSRPLHKFRGSGILQRGRKSSFSQKILAKNSMLEKRLAKMAKELHQLNLTAQQHARECKKEKLPNQPQETVGLQRLDSHSEPKAEGNPFDVLESPQSTHHHEVLAAHEHDLTKDVLHPRIQTSDQAVQVNTIQDSFSNLQPILPQGATQSKGNLGTKDSRLGSQNFPKFPDELTSAADLDKVNETMMTAKFAHSTSMFVAQSPMFPSPILAHHERLGMRRDSNYLSLERNLNESSAMLLGIASKPFVRRTSVDTSQELGDMTLAGQSPWMNSSMSRL